MAPAKTAAKRSPPPRRSPKPKSYEARLLKLAAWILSSSEPVTRGAIYAEFADQYRGRDDGKERMFTRDKEALKKLGFNVEAVEVGGTEQWAYTIDARSSTIAPIELAPEEAAAAWTAGVAALRLSAHPMREELESALRKLVVGTRSLPPRAAMTEELGGDGPADGGASLRALVGAWEKRRRITIGYWRVSAGEVVTRDVDVYGWARRRGEWIFVGHCHLRGGTRIFYLSRVRSLKLAKRDLARQKLGKEGDYDLPEGFDVRRWSRQQIWDYEVAPPAPATVRFRGPLAGIAHHLLPGASLASDGEGGRVARLEVRNLRGLVRQALAWGPDAEVTGPPEARVMAREILASTLSTRQRGTP